MKLVAVCVVLFALLVGSLEAGPAIANSPALLNDLKSSFLGERAPVSSLTKRQGGVCTNNSDCIPPEFSAGVPSNLIECILPGGLCSCNECFEVGSSGTCVEVECEDWRYDQKNVECDDNRPKQLTAFLLSFFLSGTGAANFYIGRDDLGGVQLFLLLLTIVASYAASCMLCWLGCCIWKSNDDIKGTAAFAILVVIFAIVIVLATLATSAWWLADLIIFATNKRDAGNGCMLQGNL